MDIVSILMTVDLFRGLSDEQLTEISAIVERIHFQEGDAVCRKGDAADHIFIISQGQVAVHKGDTESSDSALLFLGQGQIVGEMTLVDEGRRSASIIAIENDTCLYSIPNKSLMELCQKNTTIGFLIMRNIAQDLSFKLRHRDYDNMPAGDHS